MDESRVVRFALDEVSEPMDVHVNGSRFAGVVVPPYLLEKLVACEHLARMTDEKHEEFEDLRLHGQGFPVAQESVSGDICLDGTQLDDSGGLRHRRSAVRAPEQCSDA